MNEAITETRKPNRLWAIIIGAGVALSPIHNQYLTQLTSNSNGETLFFLPAFGYLLLIMGAGMFLAWHWNQVKEAGWGDKRILIPMLAIVGATGISGLGADGVQDKLAPLFLAGTMLAAYFTARVLGVDVFLPVSIGAAVASVGVVAYQITHLGRISGGYVFEYNYDIVVGYILLGTLLCTHRWRWYLSGLAGVALLMTGSPEGVFALGVLAVALVVRADWNRKMLFAILPAALILVLWLGIGQGQKLYSYLGDVILNKATVTPASDMPENDVNRGALGYRIWVIEKAMKNLEPLGTGYSVTEFREGIVHNVPLVIVQQLGWAGIPAGLAWLWVSVFCLVKTKWKYVWLTVLSLSVFDHFIFTHLAPWWWVIAGISLQVGGQEYEARSRIRHWRKLSAEAETRPR